MNTDRITRQAAARFAAGLRPGDLPLVQVIEPVCVFELVLELT